MYTCAHTYIAGDPLPCGYISRAAFIGMSLQKHVARFRGQRDIKVRQDFEEIQYTQTHTHTEQLL